MARNEGGPAACQRELDQELGNNWKTEVWEGARLRQRAKVQSWERGIVEKELVKKDYRTVLEAWWTR